jgi:TonB family protein
MTKYLASLTFVFYISITCGFGQQVGITINQEAKQEEPVFTSVEEMPEFIGGETARMKFIKDSLKYPDNAKQKGIQGKVYVSYVVNNEGKVDEVKVIRGITGGSELEKEAVRVVKSFPIHKPGKQNGRAVSVQMVLPINFVLKNKNSK